MTTLFRSILFAADLGGHFASSSTESLYPSIHDDILGSQAPLTSSPPSSSRSRRRTPSLPNRHPRSITTTAADRPRNVESP